jgi:hypothetical protein
MVWPHRQLVVRDDGEHGDFPSPLAIFPPVTPLDWALYCVKDICLLVGPLCAGMRIRLWLSWQPLKTTRKAIEEDHYRGYGCLLQR